MKNKLLNIRFSLDIMIGKMNIFKGGVSFLGQDLGFGLKMGHNLDLIGVIPGG